MPAYLLSLLLLSAPTTALADPASLPAYEGSCFVERDGKNGYQNVHLKQDDELSLLKENGYEFKVAYSDHDPFWSDEGTPTLTLRILKGDQAIATTSTPLSNRIFRPISLVLPEQKLRFYCRSTLSTDWVCKDDGITELGGGLQK